ncbi:hypothetical protein SFK304_0938 [Shigella flexneri K-304]|nr:hypothetical protein SFy_0953 [Shigella flexneri 2003036]EGJ91661.1 hypothetical protein SF274771_0856 [Shigella flexneri 2747-71]EGK40469.1 hypothetical protein SFK304_0938 [Shigella flexneri K-304]
MLSPASMRITDSWTSLSPSMAILPELIHSARDQAERAW